MSSTSSVHCGDDFVALNIAVLTVSDTREDHKLAAKEISKDDVYQLRAVVSKWIADDSIHVILTTGGTGFTARDNTPEALLPLFDKDIEGFGEVFRTISLAEIGTSTIQSRAFGGMANGTVILSVPGSTNACKTAWDKLIVEQLDASHRPCNFVPHLNFK